MEGNRHGLIEALPKATEGSNEQAQSASVQPEIHAEHFQNASLG
jgi:hypothetical protein